MDTLIIIILISCAVAGLICLGLYSAMKPVSKKQTAGQYVSQERLVMSINEDNFIRETESRTRIANQAIPGMPAGSAGAAPGQNMTISASSVQPTQHSQGQHGPGGFINLGGGASGHVSGASGGPGGPGGIHIGGTGNTPGGIHIGGTGNSGNTSGGMIHFGGPGNSGNMGSSASASTGHGPHVPSHGGTSHSSSSHSVHSTQLAGNRPGRPGSANAQRPGAPGAKPGSRPGDFIDLGGKRSSSVRSSGSSDSSSAGDGEAKS